MKNKENSEKSKQLISNFLRDNSFFGRKAEFANMIFHQPFKKYFILKEICGGNIIGGIPENDVSFPQLANPIVPIKIIPKKKQEIEFKNLCDLIFKIFESKQYGISYDDAIRYLNELYQNSHDFNEYFSSSYLSEIKQKLTRYNDFDVKRQRVKNIYERISKTREEYVKKSLVSYSLTKYILNELPSCSGQKPGDEQLLNYYYVCSSESSECRRRNTKRYSPRLDDFTERLCDTEDISQNDDVPLARATQALQRIICYGFDSLTAEPLVMRELVILFGSEKAPLFARLSLFNVDIQEFIIDKLKKRIVGLSIYKWRHRDTTAETYEQIYPIQRGLYSNVTSVQKAKIAIHNFKGYNNILFNSDCLSLLYTFIEMCGMKAEKTIQLLQKFFENSLYIASQYHVSYEEAEILVSSAHVITFISNSIKFINKKRRDSWSLSFANENESRGIKLASEVGLTSPLYGSERFVSLFVKSVQIKEMKDGPRLLYGVYGISDSLSAQGIAWGKILTELIQAYEVENEYQGAIKQMLQATAYHDKLSFHFDNHDEVLIKI